MCFGKTESGSKVTTTNPAVTAAANDNLSFVKNLQAQGFTPYSGQMVAGFSPQQQSSFGMADALATSGVPYTGEAKDYISTYGGAGPGSVNANTIASGMSPYMNQYVQMALAPQIEAQDQQFAAQNRNANSAATAAGAFGDARAGIEAANLTNQQNISRQGLIGNAYNAAFNTAIGASAQDQANNLNAQTTNAGLREQSLARALGASSALQGLGNYQIGQGTNLTNLQNTMGQQQTAQDQAGLSAQYQQWLMAQQYPFQTAQLYNQTISAANPAMGKTETAYAPNNSGWALAGAILPAILSDKREKKDIKKVGELKDGTPVKSFKYKKDPEQRTQIGVVAQDVEKKNPKAVVNHKGRKYVRPDVVAAANSNKDRLAAAVGA